MDKQQIKETLINSGCSKELAAATAEIIAKDDPNQPNLGRTEQEQETIFEAVKVINGN